MELDIAAKVAAILAVVALILPHVQAMLQQPHWSSSTKALFTVALSMVAGSLAYLYENGARWVGLQELVLWILGSWVAAGVSYARLWRPLGTAPTLERKVLAPRHARAD